MRVIVPFVNMAHLVDPVPGTLIVNLLLIPTQQERQTIEPIVMPKLSGCWTIELCGFGLVAAAARASQSLALHAPQRCCLVGIAGYIDPSLEIGKAYTFHAVACHGIGAGMGKDHLSASDLHWPQYYDPHTDTSIGDVISWQSADETHVPPKGGMLLSCCSASTSAVEVESKQRQFAGVAAEDMEGYAVAVACRLYGVPLTIVRGISNQAGIRDKATWQIERALMAAANAVLELAQQDE